MDPFSGFTSEASVSGRPHTPPYTPLRNKGKRRLERSDSPASSIHPTETISPAKKVPKRASVIAAEDNVRVEELADSDNAYRDADIVFPEETEEVESQGDGDDEFSITSGSGAEEASESEGMARRMSRLQCKDGETDEEAKFEKGRRQRRLSRRHMGSQVFKRSHSQSVGNRTGAPAAEVADVDTEAMDDHDVLGSKRRLRRRVRGPREDELMFEEMPGSSRSPSLGIGVGRAGSAGVDSGSSVFYDALMTPERESKDERKPTTANDDVMEIDDEDNDG
ncbi:hypothetical protein LTR78_010738 [Recurvomyces mirabilis]|uniref:Uncharacterized protein n=1 Tax=Recurvomyces mirabilis TaxID=574656 RepID=A0AAE0TPY1_9PEZI|nr:hypothetical protein LTR78_010738 [Recurvomyces mirabilis]KAK5152540.1 hypothetical protein LTS14_008487 [Recurvomyces mirabilis]